MAYARIETNDSIWDTYIGLKPLYGGPSPLHLSQNTNKNFQLQLEVIFGVCVYIYIYSLAVKPENKRKKTPLVAVIIQRSCLLHKLLSHLQRSNGLPHQIWFGCQEWWFDTQPIRYEKVHYSFNEAFEGKAPKQV